MVHNLAVTYGWTEDTIWSLPMCRLRPYLVLIDRYHGNQDAAFEIDLLPEEIELRRLLTEKMQLMMRNKK